MGGSPSAQGPLGLNLYTYPQLCLPDGGGCVGKRATREEGLGRWSRVSLGYQG